MSPLDAGAAWAAWTAVTPVAVAPAARDRYVRVRLPVAIAPAADGGYPDLRVIDASGTEVPFAIDPQRATTGARTVAVIDRGFVPNRWSQAVLDLGTPDAPVDTIRLDVDPQHDTYFERVAIDASDDRATWRVVRDDAIVYRVAQDGGKGDQQVTFGPTRSRWLRVRVLDPRAPFTITGAEVDRTQAPEPALVTLPAAPATSPDATAHRQVWTFAPAVAIRPSAVAFADAGGAYVRSVIVEASDDGKSWTPAGDGQIARFARGGAHTSFAFAERTARWWRITVDNGDDAPIPGMRPALLARSHDVVFEALPDRQYRLLSGNPVAEGPRYDLAQRLAHETWTARTASAGETVANAGFRDARPLGERYPWLLTAVLVVVAAMLGLVAVRTVRQRSAE